MLRSVKRLLTLTALTQRSLEDAHPVMLGHHLTAADAGQGRGL